MHHAIHADPFQGVRALQHQINRLFESDWAEGQAMTAEWALRVDIREEEHQVRILADVPGLAREDIHVQVENNRLTISGERRLPGEVPREGYHRIERSYGRFSRSFHLPHTLQAEGISATCRDGVLEVILPKREEAKPRLVEVQVQ
ncbi:MAG: Hsp20/alpha crystallin family protein [Magnetococcus sp. WYHC-3]